MLTENDRRKFERLEKNLQMSYRFTRLQAIYLQNFPEIITEDLISSVCEAGLTKEEAAAALMAQFFGLDTEGNADDRLLFRNYVMPSVRILDANKYKNNPYYKGVNIPEEKIGDWELKKEVYEPYRAIACDDMQIYEDFREIAPIGFFTEKFYFPAVLEGGNEWMTLTPVDLDTCEDAIEAARGKVVTFGLGLGYYAYMASLKNEVTSVTVIERSEKVIELFKKFILPSFPFPEKIKIVNRDAFEYAKEEMPKEDFDLAFVDIWRDASDGAEAYRLMRPLEKFSPETKFLYWIEGFILSRLRSLKYAQITDAITDGNIKLTYQKIIDELTDKDKLIKTYIE